MGIPKRKKQTKKERKKFIEKNTNSDSKLPQIFNMQNPSDNIVSKDATDLSRKLIKIEEILKPQKEIDDSIGKYDFLQAKYLFRFPFMITSIKWGFGMGSVFGLHSYIKTRNLQSAIFSFMGGTFLTGLPIFGFFMFKHTFYQTAVKKFEVDQNEMIEESSFKKEYVRSK